MFASFEEHGSVCGQQTLLGEPILKIFTTVWNNQVRTQSNNRRGNVGVKRRGTRWLYGGPSRKIENETVPSYSGTSANEITCGLNFHRVEQGEIGTSWKEICPRYAY